MVAAGAVRWRRTCVGGVGGGGRAAQVISAAADRDEARGREVEFPDFPAELGWEAGEEVLGVC